MIFSLNVKSNLSKFWQELNSLEVNWSIKMGPEWMRLYLKQAQKGVQMKGNKVSMNMIGTQQDMIGLDQSFSCCNICNNAILLVINKSANTIGSMCILVVLGYLTDQMLDSIFEYIKKVNWHEQKISDSCCGSIYFLQGWTDEFFPICHFWHIFSHQGHINSTEFECNWNALKKIFWSICHFCYLLLQLQCSCHIRHIFHDTNFILTDFENNKWERKCCNESQWFF